VRLAEPCAARKRALVVAAVTLLGVIATARLGVWQLDRAAQKEALQQQLEQRAALPTLRITELAAQPGQALQQYYRRVEAEGRWLHRATVFLDNRQMNGRSGFFVITPLQPLDGSAPVLVQRGFVLRDNDDRTRLPVLPADDAPVRFAAHIAPPPARLYEFAGLASGAIRQNLDIEGFSLETGLRLRPYSLVQDAAASATDVLQRQWPRPTVDVQKHYGYAFQWFALCALMTGLYVWFQLVRPRLRRSA